MAHPTQQKERLMNKILAQMMIHCRERVTDAQVDLLQTFKDNAADFDSTKTEYSSLLNFSLDRHTVDSSLPKEKQEGPVEMTQAENTMQTIVEDLSEDMKREREEEMRTGRSGTPSIFFVDLASLSGATAALYIVVILSFFGLIFWVLINKIVAKPVDFTKKKKQDRQTKKQSTGKTQ
jgi:hypothetical protein